MLENISHIEPTRKELRTFGLMMGGLICVFFGLLIPWIWGFSWPIWPYLPGGVFALTGLLAPAALGPVYRGLMKLAFVLGWINTRIILGIIFYLVLLPTSLVLRILGKDPLSRELDADVESYRVQSDKPDAEHLRRPY